MGCYGGEFPDPAPLPLPINGMSPERLRSLSTGDQPVGGQTSSSSVPSGTNVFQSPTVPSQSSVPSLRDVPINSRLEALRSRLSQAASGPTQLWLFLLELLLLNQEQRCIQWTKKGWEFLMGMF